MCPTYIFESGPLTQLSREVFSWWNTHYQYAGSPVKHVKIRMCPRTNPNFSQHILIRKKPSRVMLTTMEPSTQRTLELTIDLTLL